MIIGVSPTVNKNKSIECVKLQDCTGCGACENRCPVKAIKMEYDKDGFLFPKVADMCVNCGLCSKVCQVVSRPELFDSPKAYAVWAENDIRMESSSGGMFSLMANKIISDGGVVFGAVFTEDFKGVFITEANSSDEILPMRRSKYVFCETKDSYSRAEAYLKEGRAVLYTGTPCEIAGLKKFLMKEYDNLYTSDFVCHGANSVKAYHSWLDEFTRYREISDLNFRDKSVHGWSTTAVAKLKNGEIVRENFNDCSWYRGFLEGVTIRENCADCYFATGNRIADITMADAWGINNIDDKLNDGKGTSLVLVSSVQGQKLFDRISKDMALCQEISFEAIRKYNGNLNYPQKLSIGRPFFFAHLDEYGYNKALWYGRNRRWNVGIVGWWFASNYGSALTYYGLANEIQKTGNNVIFIPVPLADGNPWDKDTERVETFIGKHFSIARKRTIDNMKEYNAFCDSFVLGSDQMWTESSTKLVGYSFFLDFVDINKKKIAVAPSFGAGRFSNNPKMVALAKDYLNRFDAISVREESAIQICKDLFDVEVEQIIDPIFWTPKEEYQQIVGKSTAQNEGKYLLCYILDPNQEKIDIINRLACEKNLQVISILGMREYWKHKDSWSVGKLLHDVSVETFVDYINNAEFVVTDSHHGACMSIILNRQYVAIGNRQRGLDRFLTIGKLLGLESRIIAEARDLDYQEVNADIDFKEVNNNIMREAERGMNWFKDAYAKETITASETMNTLLKRIEDLEAEVSRLKNRK